jgi:two-component system sensor histidine kinase and response regulator WspE
VRVTSEAGKGTQFRLQLPVTLSVLRTLLAEIGGKPYAFPLGFIVRTLELEKGNIDLLEGRQHFEFEGRRVGLVTAHQILGTAEPQAGDRVPVIVVGDSHQSYVIVIASR